MKKTKTLKRTKILATIVAILWLICFGLLGLIGSDTTEPKEELKIDVVSEAIKDYNLDESAYEVIYNFIPNAESIIKISQDGTHSYQIEMNDKTIYLMAIFAAGENKGKIAAIQTNEEDYELRTRLYNFGD